MLIVNLNAASNLVQLNYHHVLSAVNPQSSSRVNVMLVRKSPHTKQSQPKAERRSTYEFLGLIELQQHFVAGTVLLDG